MPALQVRDFPADLYEDLRRRAKSEHRSVSQQTIVAIREHLSPCTATPVWENGPDAGRQARIERRRRLFAELDQLPRPEAPENLPSIVETLKEARDENNARHGL
ncbi:MAG: hypothetical protein LBH64_00340 [Coriobacteriales bacterium]|nr:hypothetical protein [Coriobacteriales bacterium]